MVLHAFSAAGVGVCVALAAGAPQAEAPREWVLLGRIKQQMAQNLSRLPDYTCLETIERSTRPGGSGSFQRLDLLRVEVAQVGSKELFAWPGARRFEEKSLGEMVGVGAIGTGDFALHARSVFRSSVPTFRYLGEQELNGRRTLGYEYRVTRFNSGYIVHTSGGQATVPYRGSFWVDAGTLELLRLDVQADEIPPELGISSVATQIHYGSTRIGPSDFLLPQSAEVLLTLPSGAAKRNRIEFTHCRQYSTEAVVSFGPPAEEQPVAGAGAGGKRITEIELPAGLSLVTALETEIDSEKSAVGDLIQARVLKDVKQQDRLMVPRGAMLTGRIRSLGRHPDYPEYFVVGLEFSEVEFGNSRGRFLAQMENRQAFPGATRQLSFSRTTVSGTVLGDGRSETTRNTTRTTVELPGVGLFFIEASRVRLPRGFRLVWRTTEPGPSQKP